MIMLYIISQVSVYQKEYIARFGNSNQPVYGFKTIKYDPASYIIVGQAGAVGAQRGFILILNNQGNITYSIHFRRLPSGQIIFNDGIVLQNGSLVIVGSYGSIYSSDPRYPALYYISGNYELLDSGKVYIHDSLKFKEVSRLIDDGNGRLVVGSRFVMRLDYNGSVKWLKLLDFNNLLIGILSSAYKDGNLYFTTVSKDSAIVLSVVDTSGILISSTKFKHNFSNTQLVPTTLKIDNNNFLILGRIAFPDPNPSDNILSTPVDGIAILLDGNYNIVWSKYYGIPSDTMSDGFSDGLIDGNSIVVGGSCGLFKIVDNGDGTNTVYFDIFACPLKLDKMSGIPVSNYVGIQKSFTDGQLEYMEVLKVDNGYLFSGRRLAVTMYTIYRTLYSYNLQTCNNYFRDFTSLLTYSDISLTKESYNLNLIDVPANEVIVQTNIQYDTTKPAFSQGNVCSDQVISSESQDTNFYYTIKGNKIIFKDDVRYKVFSVDGRLILSGEGKSVKLSRSGLYMIKTDKFGVIKVKI